MDKDLKGRWLAALRSGRYEKCTGQLRESKTAFCAIGVLWDTINPNLWRRNADGCLYDWSRIPEEGYRFADIEKYLDGDSRVSVEDLNDTCELPFAEIADWIETHL